jgi:hypothetical protein
LEDFRPVVAAGGYNGPCDLQIEYTITGANGQDVNFNTTFFAHNPQFTSGNLTRDVMLATMKHEVDYYKSQAAAAGGPPHR